MTERITAAVGMARYLADTTTNRLHVDLGDFHPSAHGGLELELDVDNGEVTACSARIGLMHRSVEKLFESRDYRQIMMLANRHDWLSAVSSEIGVALAVEQATGISPPDRATWSRMLLMEAGRIGASALLIASAGVAEGLRLREQWARWQERATGGRVHPMVNRIGGLERPIPSHALDDIVELCDYADALTTSWRQLFTERADLIDLAAMDLTTAKTFSCSGPVGQGSGLDWDLRRDEPYLHYREIKADWSSAVYEAGDARARYLSLLAGIPLSSQVIRRSAAELRELDADPFSVPLPKTLRAPEGLVYIRTQNPLGIAGWLLVSDGDNMPVRLKARTPSFAHLQAMQHALVGTPIDHLSPAIGSFFFVTGDADR